MHQNWPLGADSGGVKVKPNSVAQVTKYAVPKYAERGYAEPRYAERGYA